MASYAKLLLLIAIALGAVLPMLIKGPDGKPIMSLGDWVPADEDINKTIGKVTSLGKKLEHNTRQVINTMVNEKEVVVAPTPDSATVEPLSSNQMYKWKDKNGNWQFSNQKPADISSVKIEDLPEVKNVMDAPVTRGKNSSTIGLPDGLSLENAGELLKKMGLSTEQQTVAN